MERLAVDIGLDCGEDLALESRVCLWRNEMAPVQQLVSSEIAPNPVGELPPLIWADCDFEVLDRNVLIDHMREASMCAVFQRVSQVVMAPGRQRQRDVRVFCNFLSQGKKHFVTLKLKDAACRGVDIVEHCLKVALDDRSQLMYSANPRQYKLFMADDATGEEEAPIQLDSMCGNFTYFSLSPLPAAQLFLFPTRSALLSAPADDPVIAVEVKDGPKSSRRMVTLPLDITVVKLEAFLSDRLTTHCISPGTLKVRYGPLELHPSEVYDFGAGCGSANVSVGEWTVHSCIRFGVTEMSVGGRIVEEDQAPQSPEGALGHLRRMDEEEARAYQQFDVIKINKFGVRQQRIIGVDGERVYNMRPLSEVGKTKNPERLIEDIEVVRDFRERPTYCEIEYNKASKYDTDRIECKNSADCIILVEKLRMLKRIHGRRLDTKRTDTTLSRFFSRLGFGK